ncbi:MAG TPA: hypothetical protein VJG32_05200 [Anaerolineae bacterium]|nr:hypothetical protein [Anaerolineae bacterium]
MKTRTFSHPVRLGLLLLATTYTLSLVLAISLTAAPPAANAARVASTDAKKKVYLPLVTKPRATSGGSCQPIPGASYTTMPPSYPIPGAENNHLINVGLRGYEPINAHRGLITTGGQGDPNAPQFPGLFANNRTATFRTVYAIHKWDESCKCPSPVLVTAPEVSLAGLATTAGEIIHLPDSGYDIGGGYDALVLYADADSLTVKYTREDDIVSGYTLYLEKVCVEPNLLALYRSSNAAGRDQLPVLRGRQPLGRATGQEIGVAVRDSGRFQDPRVRNAWWLGR